VADPDCDGRECSWPDKHREAVAVSESEPNQEDPAMNDLLFQNRCPEVEQLADPALERPGATGELSLDHCEPTVRVPECAGDAKRCKPCIEKARMRRDEQRPLAVALDSSKWTDGGIHAQARDRPLTDEGGALDGVVPSQPAHSLRRRQLTCRRPWQRHRLQGESSDREHG
jgi:hypothetical protein